MLDKTSHRNGCTAEAGPDFGSPHRQQSCRLPDGTKRVRLAGLFKDTYLTCQVQAPAKEDDQTLAERADEWCVQVANAPIRDGRSRWRAPRVASVVEPPVVEPVETYAVCSAPRRQRMPASRKPSMSPSSTDCGLPDSYSVRRSLTIWYGFST